MTRQRMGNGDAAWLHMDRPTNLMVVNSVMWFDETPDWDDVRQLLQERIIARFPRFSQRVTQIGPTPYWEDDDEFDLERHLHEYVLPAPGGRLELQRYLSWTLHKPLPLDRPLWEAYLIDGYRGSGCAIAFRIHHCIADGVALMRVMLSLTDDPTVAAEADVSDPADGGSRHRFGPLPALAHLAGSMVDDIVHPTHIGQLLHDATAGSRAAAKLVSLPPDHHTSLQGHAGHLKSVVWSDPISLEEVKTAAHLGAVTVNDLILSAVSGALRSYLAREDGQAPDIRAIVPFNIRPLDKPLPADLGNKFGLVYLSLPVSVDDPWARLLELRSRMTAIKHSAEGVVSFGVLDLVGRMPCSVEQLFVDTFAGKGTAVMTNVPGPRRPVYLAGRRVRGTIGWPPESGNIGMGVSIISYDGELTIGLMTDVGLVHEPQAILDDVRAELGVLLTLCRAAAEDVAAVPAAVSGG